MPRAPVIFERKTRWALEEVEGTPDLDRANYKSVKGYEDQVEALFREEEALGWMIEMDEEEARRRYGKTLHLASLAVVVEKEKIRVVHDATHGVQVNHRIRT